MIIIIKNRETRKTKQANNTDDAMRHATCEIPLTGSAPMQMQRYVDSWLLQGVWVVFRIWHLAFGIWHFGFGVWWLWTIVFLRKSIHTLSSVVVGEQSRAEQSR